MNKYNYSENEKQKNNILRYQEKELSKIDFSPSIDIEAAISSSEELLNSLDVNYLKTGLKVKKAEKKFICIPTWDDLLIEAENNVGIENKLEDLFSIEELSLNKEAIQILNKEYSNISKIDKYDIGIASVAGVLGATVDVLLIGIPQKGKSGISAGTLSDYIRERFEDKFPEDEMEKLANSKRSKVSFDAQDNRNTKTYVEGMSAYYHRLLTLGHDPLLGFIVGVFDIITGRMTTIDKSGKFVSQVMDNYADRKESDIFKAIAKQIIHFKSDITTSMGLPAPLMSLFNFLQFASIGEEEQTIAEIVQGMYYEGYDFIHFCAQSIPVMIIEIVIRMGYSIKRIKEGCTIKESIPVSTDQNIKADLRTMLFIGHSIATATNVGKIIFTKSPMAINYPQWLAFVKYSFSELTRIIIEDPKARDEYVQSVLNEEFDEINEGLLLIMKEFSEDYIFEFEG